MTENTEGSTGDAADRGKAAASKAPQRQTRGEVAAAPVAEPIVKARITKMGANQVSTGAHIPTAGDEVFAFGEVVSLPTSVAEALEAKGFVEIQ